MPKTIKLALLAFVLAASVAQAKKKKAPPAPQVVAVADQEVATPIGGFKFTHLTLSPDNILPNWYKFNGVATNLADHRWTLVFFRATFIGASGEAVSTEQLYYSNIGDVDGSRTR